MDKKTKMKFNILAVVCIIIFCFAITPKTMQNDTYYTIKLGEHMVQTGGLDMKDTFSWNQNLPYLYPHWLFDLATYVVYSNFGGFSAVYGMTMVLAAILGVTLYITSVKLDKNNLVSFVMTLVIMYCAKAYITGRAQLVTFILFALTIYNIEKFIESGKLKNVIALIIIPIIIANVHVAVWPFYFILYLPYLVEYLVYELEKVDIFGRIEKFRVKSKIKKIEKNKKLQDEEKNKQIEKCNEKLEKIDEIDRKLLKKKENREQDPSNRLMKNLKKYEPLLIFIFLITILTGLITPLGPTTSYTYLYKTVVGNTTKSISEHLPTVLINKEKLLSIVAVLMIVLVFTKVRITLRDYFMLAGLFLLTLMTQRQESMFMFIGFYIFVRILSQLFETYKVDDVEKVAIKMTSFYGKVITLSLVILVSAYMYKAVYKTPYVSEKVYPVQASKWIKENLDYKNIKLFNEYNYGSYLLYEDIPVFIDSRCDLYTPQYNGVKSKDGKYSGGYDGRDIFSEYMSTSMLNKYYEDTFEKYGVTHVILYKDAKMNLFIQKDKNYTELYSDDYFVIYKRNYSKDSSEQNKDFNSIIEKTENKQNIENINLVDEFNKKQI